MRHKLPNLLSTVCTGQILLKQQRNFGMFEVLATSGIAAAVCGVRYEMKLRRIGQKPIHDINKQTVILEDGSRVGTNHAGKPPKLVFNDEYGKCDTYVGAVRRGAKLTKDGRMMGRRVEGKWVWTTYKEALDRSRHLAVGLRQLGLPIGQSTTIGIFSKNRPEWVLSEMASHLYDNISVALYESFGDDECMFICRQSDIPVVICETLEKAELLLRGSDKLPVLKNLVIIETFSDTFRKDAAEKGVTVNSFSEVEDMGMRATAPPPEQLPTPHSIATICYTSGTTGSPKGVVLTHRMVMSDQSVILNLNLDSTPTHEDCALGFLPLAHVMERTIEYIVYSTGGRVGHFAGDVSDLLPTVQTLRPTIMPLVPRLLNKIYDATLIEVNKSIIKRIVFKCALAVKEHELKRFVIRTDGLADKVLSAVREKLGGRVRFSVCASAPLAPEVLRFARAVLGCIVVESYGQTETAGALSMTVEGDYTTGHVGAPIASLRVKLVDVPKMGYYTNDKGGEICVKGFNITSGYYKNDEATLEVFDEDGWLHTGDIGKWNKQGCLVILDRVKNVFKMAQGEFVAPERLEQLYSRSRYVCQIFVYGDTLKNSMVAVIVPEKEELEKLGSRLRLNDFSYEELCKDENVKQSLLRDLVNVGKTNSMRGFELLKELHVCSEPFSIENHLVTPTMKNRRPQLAQFFEKEIETMYSKLE